MSLLPFQGCCGTRGDAGGKCRAGKRDCFGLVTAFQPLLREMGLSDCSLRLPTHKICQSQLSKKALREETFHYRNGRQVSLRDPDTLHESYWDSEGAQVTVQGS